ncbi:MAG: hypothetical protein AVDCRST_MAG19-4085, partial [uncultured Thermomicrobiales bacterium]
WSTPSRTARGRWPTAPPRSKRAGNDPGPRRRHPPASPTRCRVMGSSRGSRPSSPGSRSIGTYSSPVRPSTHRSEGISSTFTWGADADR